MTPNEKIQKHSDKYVVFYSSGCPYSERAVSLLQQSGVSHRDYEIANITPSLQTLLKHFSQDRSVNGYIDSHRTRPIVFNKGTFIGGYTELASQLQNS